MHGKMKEYWERAMFTAGYWMIDETPGLVGCEDADGNRVYREKYFWSITDKVLKRSCCSTRKAVVAQKPSNRTLRSSSDSTQLTDMSAIRCLT